MVWQRVCMGRSPLLDLPGGGALLIGGSGLEPFGVGRGERVVVDASELPHIPEALENGILPFTELAGGFRIFDVRHDGNSFAVGWAR